MSKTLKITLIELGWASWGWTGFDRDHARMTGSGCASLEAILADYPKACEGAFVYDASATEHDEVASRAFMRWVSGPIYRPCLKAGTFQSIVTGRVHNYTKNTQLEAFDSVCLDIHINALRKIPLIRFGCVVNGAVQWEPPALSLAA